MLPEDWKTDGFLRIEAHVKRGRLMHLVPAPAVRLMKRRVLSRPGVNRKVSWMPHRPLSAESKSLVNPHVNDRACGSSHEQDYTPNNQKRTREKPNGNRRVITVWSWLWQRSCSCFSIAIQLQPKVWRGHQKISWASIKSQHMSKPWIKFWS